MNFRVGMILPRAMPAISDTMHSTSVMRRSLSHLTRSSALSTVSSFSLPIAMGHHSFLISIRGRVLAYRVSKRAEQFPGYGILPVLPLRVPLHAKRKSLRSAHLHGLHGAVCRATFRYQAVGDARNTLPMQRVYLNHPCAKQIFEDPPLDEGHLMRGPVLHIERIVLLLAMIEARRIAGFGRHFLQVLVQRAAEGNVQLLEAAADGKERHGPGDAGADQVQREPGALARAQ